MFILGKDNFSHKPSLRFVNAAKLSLVIFKKTSFLLTFSACSLSEYIFVILLSYSLAL